MEMVRLLRAVFLYDLVCSTPGSIERRDALINLTDTSKTQNAAVSAHDPWIIELVKPLARSAAGSEPDAPAASTAEAKEKS
jgi:hypothetical protein